MDLDAVLARHPQVALVDELAHTNVPGSRNPKRWQDIEEMLDAGIDVITTLNIQHLDSLNDVVREITGVVQRETLPDEIARRAEQIELVDMTPEALRRRMVHGNVYPPDRIEAALTHYFRPGNLTALRELALLWVADRVDEGLRRYRAEHGIAAGWETRERILIALSGGPEGETVIRRAARVAERIQGADLLAVHVVPTDGLTGPANAGLSAQRTLVQSLGGSYHQIAGDDVATALLQFAQAENTTQIVLGATRRSWLASALTGGGVAARVIRDSGPIDVHLVSHERAAGPTPLLMPHRRGLGLRRSMTGVALASVLLPALTLMLTALREHLTLSSDLLAYLLAVILVALIGGLYPALATAVAAILLATYYFTPPVHTLAIANPNDIVALAVFVSEALLVSWAVETAGRQTRRAARASAEAEALGMLATAAPSTRDLPALLESVRELFGLQAISLLDHDPAPHSPREWYVLASCGDQPPEQPAEGDVTVPIGQSLILAGRGRTLGDSDQRVLVACASQIAAILTHQQLLERAASADQRAASDRARTTMLLAAHRDMQAPLVAVQAALDQLCADDKLSAPQRRELAASAQTNLARVATFLIDLQNLAQAYSGALDIHLRPVEFDDVLSAALDDLGPGGRTIVVDLPEDVPDVIADADLLSRAITSLTTQALDRSPPTAPPAVTVTPRPDSVAIHIVDHGPTAGVPTPATSEVASPSGIALRAAQDLIEGMEGSLATGDTPGGGLTVTVTLPRAAAGASPTAPTEGSVDSDQTGTAPTTH
jgi:two-component system sensor histidine kinase KdpD